MCDKSLSIYYKEEKYIDWIRCPSEKYYRGWLLINTKSKDNRRLIILKSLIKNYVDNSF
jgi:hypothetical protein